MDKTEYRQSEIIDGPKEERYARNFGHAHSWMNEVAEEGRDDPAFYLPGWWKVGQGGERSANLLMPWIFFDLDKDPEQSFSDIYTETVSVIARLHSEWGVDATGDFFYASFSGGKGFHLQMSAAAFGMPYFESAIHAHSTLKDFFSPLLEEFSAIDPKPWSPLIPIRLTNSRHRETGNRKWTLPANVFCKSSATVEWAVENEVRMEIINDETTPFVDEFPHPFEGELAPDRSVAEKFAKSWEKVKEDNRQTTPHRERVGERYLMSRVMYKAWQGVGESEEFAVGHDGRDEAAFCLACHFLRTGRTAEQVVSLLKKWDRIRNTPPLQEDPDEQAELIELKVRSAVRRLYEEGEIDTLYDV